LGERIKEVESERGGELPHLGGNTEERNWLNELVPVTFLGDSKEGRIPEKVTGERPRGESVKSRLEILKQLELAGKGG